MTDRLVWIDCEMTGLDLAKDALIEIAALVTDAELNVLTTLGRPGSSEVTLGFPSGSKERTRRSRPPSL